MKKDIKNDKNVKLNIIFDWLLHMLGYSFILFIVSKIFKNTIQINYSDFGLWFFLASIIIYVLNKTIKPIIFWLTLPLTGLTMGLFYPFLNVLILNLTDFILGNNFNIHGIFMSFLVAICISLLNIFMQEIFIKSIMKVK